MFWCTGTGIQVWSSLCLTHTHVPPGGAVQWRVSNQNQGKWILNSCIKLGVLFPPISTGGRWVVSPASRWRAGPVVNAVHRARHGGEAKGPGSMIRRVDVMQVGERNKEGGG